jgi:putative toxin-antitoxin system antitoxin component (TIGR02293 family)
MAIKKERSLPQVKKASTVKEKSAKQKRKGHVIYNTDETEAGRVSEPEVIYSYQPFYVNDISLLTSSKKGLKAKAALDFLSLSGFTQDEFQETFKTTVKTIQNHVTRELTLDAALSEKLLKSFALFDKGTEIFGSAKNFHQWLGSPAYGLGNQLPFDLMDTITGIHLIEEELIRIEYGDLA